MVLRHIKGPSPATLRFASVLTHSNNTAYTAHFVRPNFGYAETSYMLGTLSVIPFTKFNVAFLIIYKFW